MSNPQAKPPQPTCGQRFSAWLRTQIAYILILLAAVALSVGGIVYAVKVSGRDVDAGRGGALADVVALAVYFLWRGYGSKLYQILTAPPDEEETLAQGVVPAGTTDRANLLYQCMKLDAKEAQWQNRYLAAITVIGTLTWGFGDIIAHRFLP